MMSMTSLSFANSVNSFEYNICNGLANQLIQHISAISYAITNKLDINIPDAFITSGVQTSDLDVLPSKNYTIPLRRAFDIEHLLNQVSSYGIAARIMPCTIENCIGFSLVSSANHTLMMDLLSAFRPTYILNSIISQAINSLGLDTKDGVCFHHRNGQDWQNHCERWSSINDGVYRGNCLGLNESLLESLEVRGLDNKNKYVFYCGDSDFPENIESSGFEIVTKWDILSKNNLKYIKRMYGEKVRDIYALLDFFLCKSMDTFVGNSVSTWSALQIAERKGIRSFWYNSGSIPLSTIWNVFYVPIVYTYTERSARTGIFLLKASILSVRKYLPDCPVHILYNGMDDVVFLKWLERLKVTIHHHDPPWTHDIEIMRYTGSAGESHLFAHSGNYFGTWQRIDLPLFIKSEYCLLLDSDTILKRPFTLADFGLKLTSSISMGAEFNPHDTKILNAGIMLMNIPFLRKTHSKFIDFVIAHRDGKPYTNPCPSDQGAYNEFYEDTIQVLPGAFNFKPYWNLEQHHYESAFILHFHGVKPYDYQKKVLGMTCDPATEFICNNIPSFAFLCSSIQHFYLSLVLEPLVAQQYCAETFSENNTELCKIMISDFSSIPPCKNTTAIVLHSSAKIPFTEFKKPLLHMSSFTPHTDYTQKAFHWFIYLYHLPFSILIFRFMYSRHICYKQRVKSNLCK